MILKQHINYLGKEKLLVVFKCFTTDGNMISTILKDKIMNEEQTLIYWEKWLKGKESLIRQCCEEIGNADTSEERNFYHRVYDLIQSKY